MGNIYNLKCNCGYSKNRVLIGCGRAGVINVEPLYCKSCSILFLANVRNENIICPECAGTNIQKYVGDLWEEGKKTKCPACRKKSLAFIEVGCWD